MNNEVVIVSGCSRCGSSLMMRMLEAGGIETHDEGNKVSYECHEAQEALINGRADFVGSLAGKAVKMLDPHRVSFPPVPIAWVWMSRNATEQAKSQIKLVGMMFSALCPNPDRLALSLARDNLRVPIDLSRVPGSRLMVVDFERLVGAPGAVIPELVGFLNRPMDQAKMLACVIDRPPECAPGLEIELARTNEVEAARAAAIMATEDKA